MDNQRFDALTRVFAGGLPRRGVLRTLAATAIAGAVSRSAVSRTSADGNLGDHCNKKNPCKDPLVCINTECDNCVKSGDCHDGWCCKGYRCESHQCVACSNSHRGVGAEGCKRKKKRKKKH
jgi:hypothetical protein